ncbi:MAG: transporter [Elusimicrobia bacterium]|nr:transporter [Candidatus Obscuribacterium magneticum]
MLATVGYAQEDWNPISAGPIITWTAPLCEKGKWIVQPFLFYNHTRGSFNQDGHYRPLAARDRKEQVQEMLFAQYGLTEKWEIDAQTVVQQNWAKRGDVKAHANGLGDSFLFGRYCGIEEKDWRPQVTALFQLKIPTGKYQHADPGKIGTDLMGAGTGGGSWDPGFGVILSKKIKPVWLHADLIYNVPQKVRVDGVKIIYGQYLNLDVGAEYFLPRGFNLMLEANGLLQQDKKEAGETIGSGGVDSLILAPGVGWSNDKVQTLIGYLRVLAGANTDANDSLVLTSLFTF